MWAKDGDRERGLRWLPRVSQSKMEVWVKMEMGL